MIRADIIVPVGGSKEAKELPDRFPHLINPFFNKAIFEKDMRGNRRARLLDLHNSLSFWHDTPEWKALDERGIRSFTCVPDDPLADAILARHGAFPDPGEVGIDYGELLSQATLAIDVAIDKAAPLPLQLLQHPSFNYLSRLGLRRHHTVRSGWDFEGYFVGDAGSIDDLVYFWNLRAADISLEFLDPSHIARYEHFKAECDRLILARVANLADYRRNIAIWTREERIKSALELFEGRRVSACPIGDDRFWKGGAVYPPMMIMGEASSLGVFGKEAGKPRVNFALNAKPFSDAAWFSSQHLVASLSLFAGDDQHTFHPPFVPEWNEFYARNMHFEYNKFRIEPERLGIVIDAADHDSFILGLPVSKLIAKLFEFIGLRASLSGGGLITNQVVSRMGGLMGARPFKIPGVRRLLKTFGPRDTFTRNVALGTIGRKDPRNPLANFDSHKHLHIEARDPGQPLTPGMVFEYLVEKGLFRIGATLLCPSCNLESWIALDVLKQQNVCELCGISFDATRQLVNGVFHYRRTGVLGLEKNSQGAIPVTLLLQQLDANVAGIRREGIFACSYDLVALPGHAFPKCETDFVVIIPDTFPEKAKILIGECKDEGGNIDSKDVENLRVVADAFPTTRFETYIVLAKLAPFTAEEVELARTLNGPYQRRVILLTEQELEPYHIFERAPKALNIEMLGGSPEDLAAATQLMYFEATATQAAPSPDNAPQIVGRGTDNEDLPEGSS